jgi:hypothetical protein
LIGQAIGCRREVESLRQRSASRAGEAICQFARSFDVRQTDTWVLRAVYEALQGHLRWVNPAFVVAHEQITRRHFTARAWFPNVSF